MANIVYLILIVLVVLAGVLFGAANQQLVELDVLVTQFELRLVDITVLSLLLGVVLGIFISILFRLRSRFKKRASQTTTT
ncbi:lipopolysaccharide assembly protein LapA domain-containing protein [Alkalimonas collagenimarina]|uniref:Lipopolysaccharide assembly protein LapA domain-containing protein n=1 Tax=Alkalimonas collagenimarina TaxID=400390 RepID=A0ABT9H2D9_9GAMM|nr:lipopolysaccharide assembly protein LapA domain-containing protein [Alkalimonas collagenimarina]MDP4537463.1 lipopolysaccharide assembly protein LapA domain-containing protein [Alkalimonas collagenimarina]